MKRRLTFVAAAVAALAATAPAFASSQLIASAGLTAEQAEGLTLNQIAAAKYNRDRSFSDRQAVVIEPGNAGVSQAELNAFAVASYNAGKSQTDVQRVPAPSGVTVSTRSVVDPSRHAQLIASAGLTPEEAKGLTLNQIVAAKYNRDVSFADQQRVGNTY
jgi:hypothetical protein